MMNKKTLIIFLVIPLFLGLGGIGTLAYSLYFWEYQGPQRSLTIGPGEAFSKINGRLKREGLIHSSKVFYHYSKHFGLMKKFKTGTFTLKPGLNMVGVIEVLLKGKSKPIKITIPEGKNIFQIGKALEAKGITSYEKFIREARNQDFLDQVNVPAHSAEGYLFPDTYLFESKTPPRYIIRKMVRNFFNQTRGLDFFSTHLSPHQVITLASIVEKETGAAFERGDISGVFHNRLRKRMRLQSDPTTIYGIYETFNGNLKRKHLRQKTPYNTYKIPALPKGPIANPGMAAIKAVLNPVKHKYLYFVSKNDGTHYFSKNYKEHLRAVTKFQKTRSNRLGKSWRDLAQKKKTSLSN